MNRGLLIIVVIAVLAAGAWFVLRDTDVVEDTGVADAVEDATDAVEETVEETVEAAGDVVEETVEATEEAVEEAVEAVEEAVEDVVEDATEAEAAAEDAVEEAVEDATETATDTATDGLASLLTVDGFDFDQVIAAIDGSDLSDFRKASLRTAVTGAQNNPELLENALASVRTALGL